MSFYFEVSIFQTNYEVEYQIIYALLNKYDNCNDYDNDNYNSTIIECLLYAKLSIEYSLCIMYFNLPKHLKNIPIFWIWKQN